MQDGRTPFLTAPCIRVKSHPIILDIQFPTYWCVLRREWMGMGGWMGCWGNGIIITSDYGSFPHSLRLAPVSLEAQVSAKNRGLAGANRAERCKGPLPHKVKAQTKSET